MATDEPDLARSFTLRLENGRPLTVNAGLRMHRMAVVTHTSEVRGWWCILARQAKIPHLDYATIVVTPLHKDRRSPQDVGACALEAKAAIDGLVDAGVLTDDNPKYLNGLYFKHPRVCGVDGLELTITEIPKQGEHQP